MLKIKKCRKREWALFDIKVLCTCGVLVGLFGGLFGLARCVGAHDGSLVLICRVCRNYRDEDAILAPTGEVFEFGDNEGGVVAGKIIAELKVRNFENEAGK